MAPNHDFKQYSPEEYIILWNEKTEDGITEGGNFEGRLAHSSWYQVITNKSQRWNNGNDYPQTIKMWNQPD